MTSDLSVSYVSRYCVAASFFCTANKRRAPLQTQKTCVRAPWSTRSCWWQISTALNDPSPSAVTTPASSDSSFVPHRHSRRNQLRDLLALSNHQAPTLAPRAEP